MRDVFDTFNDTQKLRLPQSKLYDRLRAEVIGETHPGIFLRYDEEKGQREKERKIEKQTMIDVALEFAWRIDFLI